MAGHGPAPQKSQWRGTMPCVLIIFCASCTRQVQVASQPSTNTKTHAMLMRQVENAVDFGDGDPEARRLRQRLAANAGEIGRAHV